MSKFSYVTPNPPILQGKLGVATFEGTHYKELLDLVYTPVLIYPSGGVTLCVEWKELNVNIYVGTPRTNALALQGTQIGRNLVGEKRVEVNVGGVLVYSTLM